MPSRNVIKYYEKGYFYHIYNRGSDKRIIFLDSRDYRAFVYYLRCCADPKMKTLPNGLPNKRNISEEIDILAFCLMPNHFHLLVKLNVKDGITRLLRRVSTSYSMRFNKKYDREGSLFQGKPKAVIVNNESQLVHLTKYIHLNPIELPGIKSPKDFQYSSYKYYLGLVKEPWIKTKEIFTYFGTSNNDAKKRANSYEVFVENQPIDSNSIRKVILE